MNKKSFIIFVWVILLSACVSQKKALQSSNSLNNSQPENTWKIDKVIQTAKEYLGTPYKYAGNDKKGIDCSGLTSRAYESVGIKLPRIAGDQTQAGKKVSLQNLQKGDLVFFKESVKASNKITHVGVVSSVKEVGKDVIFIHASTSKGVMESQLFSKYWKPLIVTAVRVIE